jgi:hypothetical protein
MCPKPERAGFSPRIVSASRRTDIPRFFGEWFANRRKAGFCEARTVFGVAYRVSLLPEDVPAYLFWSKDPTPFERQLGELVDGGAAVALQFTLNGYGPPVEGNVPGIDSTIPAFLRASRILPGPDAIQWRYDPIVVSGTFDSAWHRENFRRIASRLEGATRVCNVSFVEPYMKVVRRMGEGVRYRGAEPGRHADVGRRFPGLPRAGEPELELAAGLAGIAREHGIELRGCCDPRAGLPPSACCGEELFGPYGIGEKIASAGRAPSRAGCRCLKSVDIGVGDSCPGGCLYCYANASAQAAGRNCARHDPAGVRIR